jgi:hypothetical protein
LGCIDIVSKESGKSKTIKGHSFGTNAGVGKPGYKPLIVTIDAFSFLTSVRSLHFPDFLLNNKHWGILRRKGRFYMFVL